MFHTLLLRLAPALAAEPDAASEAAIATDAPEAIDNRRSFAVLPGAFYGPTTGLGVAAYATATRPLTPHASTWPSTLSAAVVGTTRKQVSLAMWPTLYLGEANTWVLQGEAFIEHFPTRFYGLGPRSSAAHQVFTRRQVHARTDVRRRVHEHLLIGVRHRITAVDVRDVTHELDASGAPLSTPSGDALLGSGIAGEDGSVVHGAGVSVRWDTRDNDQSAHRGVLLDLTTSGTPAWLGSSHAFTSGVLDARGYVPLGYGTTLALQWRTELHRGDVPFTAMAEVGDDDLLRGLFTGRFRDRNATAAQAEVRSPVLWRFRVVGFAGAGQVFHHVSDLSEPALTWTGGGGLRFLVDPVTRSSIRMDVAGGPDGGGVIFTFGEAL